MKKGFTLIEMLIVLSILGILAVFGIGEYFTSLKRAHDAQKKQDLKEIQNALELYKLDHNPPVYIDADNNTPYPSFPNTGLRWEENNVIYMSKVPGNNNSPYYYFPDNQNLTFILAACLEYSSDNNGDICPGTDNYPCGPDNAAGKCYLVKNE